MVAASGDKTSVNGAGEFRDEPQQKAARPNGLSAIAAASSSKPSSEQEQVDWRGGLEGRRADAAEIADALTARGVATARGRRRFATSVSNVLARTPGTA
jgi:hypothetical protein